MIAEGEGLEDIGKPEDPQETLIRRLLETIAGIPEDVWLRDHNTLLALLKGHPSAGMISLRLGVVGALLRAARDWKAPPQKP